MTMRIWAALFAVMTACGVARAAESFPERQRLEGKDYVIEYSAGDEAYAQALDLADFPPFAARAEGGRALRWLLA